MIARRNHSPEFRVRRASPRLPASSQPVPPKDRKSAIKGWLEIAQSLVTICAVLAGGFWFIDQQSLKPLIKIDQTITQRPAAGQPGMTLILVDVRATNVGKTKVSLTEGHMWLKQINPVPGSDLIDAKLRDLELDPGEGDQCFFTSYLVPASVRTIQLTSRYAVPGDAKDYWELESAADLGVDKPITNAATGPK